MASKKGQLNLLPALLLLAAVVAMVVIGSLYAFRHEDETIQGQVEVTEYRVSSKVPARILEIKVREGDRVKKGDVLAILEAPDVEAKLQQAKAAEEAAQAQSEKAENGAQKEDVQSAYEMWQKAKAATTVMQQSYTRIKNLTDEGVMPRQKLDEITAQRDAAVATEKAAKLQYEKALNGARQEDKKAAQAMVNRAKGAVSEVDSYVKETRLVASADGEVTDIFPQVGELVGAGAPIMNIAVTDDMWYTFNVREDHLVHFSMHQQVNVVIPALGDKTAKAEVFYMKDLGSYATWKATKTTGQFDMKTFEVKARPQQMPKGLRPGMSVLYRP